MDPLPRHQCLIYAGPPSRHLAALAAVIHERRSKGYRCLYLNSQPMIAGLRSCLAAGGMDVLAEIADGSLILTSERSHLAEGNFDIESMIQALREAVATARADGYAGLWASGDMSWEFGSDANFARLLEYEWQLEDLFRECRHLSGVCQYHADTIPSECLRQGFIAHRGIFINETLSRINPHYLARTAFSQNPAASPAVEAALSELLDRRA